MAKKQTETGLTKARVLVSCQLGEPNDVVELTADELAAFEGSIDPDKDAVLYAESLK